MKLLELAIVSSRRVIATPEGYRVEPIFGRYVEGYLDSFAGVTLCARLVPEERASDVQAYSYTLASGRVRLLPVRDGANPVAFYLRAFHSVMRHCRRWELILVFLPSWIGIAGFLALWLKARLDLTAVYVAGDWGEVLRQKVREKGLLERLKGSMLAGLVDAATGFIARRAGMVIVAGDALLEKMQGVGPKLLVRGHPVLDLSWSSMYHQPDRCADRTIRCLFVGELVDNKGLQYLLPALASLRAEGFDVRLDAVGSGPGLAKYQALASELGLTDVCTFAGYKAFGEPLFQYYRQADVFVLPSLTEGFPRVIYEAMGHSLPVVSTEVGGIPKEVLAGVHALLVPPRSASDLAAAIRTVITDHELRRSLIRNGFKKARPVWERSPSQDLVPLCPASRR